MNRKILALLFVLGALIFLGMVLSSQGTGLKELERLVNDRSYTACGCGCCGGTTPRQECLYRSRGDSLEKIIEEDKKIRSADACKVVGCSLGVSYKYCD